jgi:hypothetical protein
MTDTPTAPAKAAKRTTAPKPKAPAKPAVGSVWAIKTKGVAEVTRPNGDTVQVHSTDGVAAYVLDVAGEFTALVPERGPFKIEAV